MALSKPSWKMDAISVTTVKLDEYSPKSDELKPREIMMPLTFLSMLPAILPKPTRAALPAAFDTSEAFVEDELLVLFWTGAIWLSLPAITANTGRVTRSPISFILGPFSTPGVLRVPCP